MQRLVRWLGVLALAAAALGLAGDRQGPSASDDPYLIQKITLGAYRVRLEWPRYAHDLRFVPVYGKVVTIWRGSHRVAETDWVYELDPLTGTDVTGDGYPDVIVRHYSGGAHCCHDTEVFSLGPEVEAFEVGGGGECRGEFLDLDGDGVYEFVTCDDLFAYVYCCYACSPLVKVVLQFEPGVGYVPASPRFPEVYEEDIAEHRLTAERAFWQRQFDSWDGTPKCEVLHLVLDLLYSGEVEEAWKALYHYYQYPDVDAFRAEIEAAVGKSRLFAPARVREVNGSRAPRQGRGDAHRGVIRSTWRG